MADKEQIMIDGVNVSECVSFDKLNGQNICCYEDTREDKIPFANFCVENKDCYFKQLVRKTHECEELKKRATIAEDNFACEVQARLYHQNEWLKFSKECEELKKQLKTSEKWRINAESLNEKLDIKNTSYRKALDEIKKVLSHCVMTGAIVKILDIINKAKGEEDKQ